VNREFAGPQTRLVEGDEVAIFPPVSGGSGANADAGKFAITFDPISLDEMAAKVLKPETGAVAVFAGVVRNVSAGKAVEHLEYEA
jgi:molybdopterin synthase catalytic subunit